MKKSHFFGALCCVVFTLTTSQAQAVPVPLEGRLETSPGSGIYQAYYDLNLDITWATDANINGPDTWNNQVAWADSLTIGGISGWRLPSADVNGDGTVVECSGGNVIGCADNEMGYLYWEEGITSASPGPFNNLLSNFYTTSTEFDSSNVWGVNFLPGVQSSEAKNIAKLLAMAVYSGDVNAVPVPAASWLFGSGILALIGMARRKKH